MSIAGSAGVAAARWLPGLRAAGDGAVCNNHGVSVTGFVSPPWGGWLRGGAVGLRGDGGMGTRDCPEDFVNAWTMSSNRAGMGAGDMRRLPKPCRGAARTGAGDIELVPGLCRAGSRAGLLVVYCWRWRWHES